MYQMCEAAMKQNISKANTKNDSIASNEYLNSLNRNFGLIIANNVLSETLTRFSQQGVETGSGGANGDSENFKFKF